MSMQRYCEIFLAVDGQWYMHLGRDEHDSYEDSDTYGPFTSDVAAHEELDYHSNPGGYNIDRSGTQEVPLQSPNGGPVNRPSKDRELPVSAFLLTRIK